MSQLSLFENEELKKSHYCPAGSRVNHIALQENVKHLLTNVICGGNLQESFAKLDQNGSWLKMFQGYCQVKMDGSLEGFSMIWHKWATMSDGVCMEQTQLEPFTKEKEFSLFPTPTTQDTPHKKMEIKNGRRVSKTGSTHSLNIVDYIKMLPTPVASMWRGAAKTRYLGGKNYKASFTQEALRNGESDPQYINPSYVELIMGFPDKWTDLNA